MKDITGKLIVISAPSGTGKTTVVKKLLQQSTNLEASVSFTTRKMRENEKEGLDYFFVSEKTFTNMIQNDDFLEHATVFGNFYGTEKKSVSENLKKRGKCNLRNRLARCATNQKQHAFMRDDFSDSAIKGSSVGQIKK